MLSVLAGVMIGLSGIIYLSLGGALGAVFFSFGLFVILNFKFNLFTGKAGLLSSQEITASSLCNIWFGNLIGTSVVALCALYSPKGQELILLAHEIVKVRNNNTIFQNILLGFLCGVLMYIAVTGYNKTNNVLFVLAPVAIFILSGYNHCVADMFYVSLGGYDFQDYFSLIPTTFGNLLGCCFIPEAIKIGR